MKFYAHETAVIDEGCEIGEGSKIWHFSHVMPNCKIGLKCNIGQNVVISPEVILGNNVKVQNNVSIYTPSMPPPLVIPALIVQSSDLLTIDGISYIRELGFKNLHPGLTKRVFSQCGEMKI